MAEEWPTPAQFKTLEPYFVRWYWNCVESVRWLETRVPDEPVLRGTDVYYSKDRIAYLIEYYKRQQTVYKAICEKYGLPIGDDPRMV